MHILRSRAVAPDCLLSTAPKSNRPVDHAQDQRIFEEPVGCYGWLGIQGAQPDTEAILRVRLMQSMQDEILHSRPRPHLICPLPVSELGSEIMPSS
jgi:hypothetical protein